jgi:transcriptional regulator with XRE-family HTH domain
MGSKHSGKPNVRLRAGRIREIAAMRNLTLSDIAFDAEIDAAHFSSMMSGRRVAGPGVRRRLQRALKHGFDDLFEIVPTPREAVAP